MIICTLYFVYIPVHLCYCILKSKIENYVLCTVSKKIYNNPIYIFIVTYFFRYGNQLTESVVHAGSNNGAG